MSSEEILHTTVLLVSERRMLFVFLTFEVCYIFIFDEPF